MIAEESPEQRVTAVSVPVYILVSWSILMPADGCRGHKDSLQLSKHCARVSVSIKTLSPSLRALQLRARGKHYIARKQFQSASDVLTEALELSQSHKLYRLRGIAYASLHRYEDSLRMLLPCQPKDSLS